MQRYVIVGGTSSIAEHCARIWIKSEDLDLTLVARDKYKAEAIAADLRVRNQDSKVSVVECEFSTPAVIEQTVEHIYQGGNVDCVLIAHGMLPSQEICEKNLNYTSQALAVNGVSPVLFAEAFASKMSHAGQGRIGIIGSVAGDRGRKSNYVYGSAKELVARYAQGLQHRFSGSNVVVTLIKPGPTKTPMTEHFNFADQQKMAQVTAVSMSIVDGMAKGKAIVYTPQKWAILMLIIRHIPRVIFNRINI